jgi:hypothetical protein
LASALADDWIVYSCYQSKVFANGFGDPSGFTIVPSVVSGDSMMDCDGGVARDDGESLLQRPASAILGSCVVSAPRAVDKDFGLEQLRSSLGLPLWHAWPPHTLPTAHGVL